MVSSCGVVSRVLVGLALVALGACAGDGDGGTADVVDSGGDTVSDVGGGDGGPLVSAVPRAVTVARATAIPACTLHVDAASGAGDGSAATPFKTIAAAVAAAADAAVICVAEGTYPESLAPGAKPLTLAGGFQSGQLFAVRDSSLYVSKAQGAGTGSFVRIEDPGPTEGQLTAIDGFEITGYSQAIYRDIYYGQRFDITHCHIHDNACTDPQQVGAGFALNNVSGTIADNVIARNTCSRGGAGALNDSTNTSQVAITGNRVEANAGDQPDISHGGGLYLFANQLTITGNLFLANTVTAWGAGLYVGAYTGGGQTTTARLSYNVYRDNRAGASGGGFFCDDSARCVSDHEIYDSNCGGNIFLDSGPDDAGPTVATFDHLTSYRGLEVGCGAPGAGVQITKNNTAADSFAFTHAIFWGQATGRDFETSCGSGCTKAKVSVAYSNVQTAFANDGIAIAFGASGLISVDPLFVDAAAHDFHLQSAFGHWTPSGYVTDATSSPALSAGDPASKTPNNPDRAGTRSELGAYGDSPEASYVR
ncbi:MAG: right-handed parallel beta-helix repeat-containing protein [Myxococcota bacterium]